MFTVPPTLIAPIPYDPYWVYVTSLMHAQGTTGTPTYTDQLGVVWLASATNPLLDVGAAKFGTTSLKILSANEEYIQADTPYTSNIDLLGGDFTVETWSYPLSILSFGTRLFCTGGGVNAYNSTNGIHMLMQFGGSGPYALGVNVSNGTGSPLSFQASGVNLNAWNHLAFCVQGTTGYLGVNGTVTSSSLSGLSRPSGAPIGRWGLIPGESATPQGYNGYIQEMRITKGIARYTSNYIVPTSPFPNQ